MIFGFPGSVNLMIQLSRARLAPDPGSALFFGCYAVITHRRSSVRRVDPRLITSTATDPNDPAGPTRGRFPVPRAGNSGNRLHAGWGGTAATACDPAAGRFATLGTRLHAHNWNRNLLHMLTPPMLAAGGTRNSRSAQTARRCVFVAAIYGAGGPDRGHRAALGSMLLWGTLALLVCGYFGASWTAPSLPGLPLDVVSASGVSLILLGGWSNRR